ncbi:transglycosylase SLT domain-containing protein [Alcaligenes faecalis]|uniref:transglycosylase SLT domain-containing protein n=1 Tax=Alcaligenes TaxID=507 RepID=UPI0035576AFB
MQTGMDGAGGWQAFHADRTERLQGTTDEALRKHFESELEVARVTMQAMGIDVPQAGAAGQTAAPQPDAQAVPGDAVPGSAQAPAEPAAADKPAAGKGAGGSQGLAENLNPQLEPYRQDIMAAAEATGIPANLLAAVIWDESKGIATAGSTNGENGMTDSGLMQLNPQTFADIKARNASLVTGDSSDPGSNIMAGALYLKDMHDQFGDWDFALRAYNSGPLSVDLADASISTTGFGTKNYVEKVNFYRETLDQGNVMPDGFPGGNQMY